MVIGSLQLTGHLEEWEFFTGGLVMSLATSNIKSGRKIIMFFDPLDHLAPCRCESGNV